MSLGSSSGQLAIAWWRISRSRPARRRPARGDRRSVPRRAAATETTSAARLRRSQQPAVHQRPAEGFENALAELVARESRTTVAVLRGSRSVGDSSGRHSTPAVRRRDGRAGAFDRARDDPTVLPIHATFSSPAVVRPPIRVARRPALRRLRIGIADHRRRLRQPAGRAGAGRPAHLSTTSTDFPSTATTRADPPQRLMTPSPTATSTSRSPGAARRLLCRAGGRSRCEFTPVDAGRDDRAGAVRLRHRDGSAARATRLWRRRSTPRWSRTRGRDPSAFCRTSACRS